MNKQYWQNEALSLRNNLNNASQQNQADREAKRKAEQAASDAESGSRSLQRIIKSYSEENRALRNRIEEMEREKNEAIIQKVNHYSLIIRGWMLNQKAYRQLANEYGKQLGLNEESIKYDAHDAALEIAEREPDLKNSVTYKGVVEATSTRQSAVVKKGP